MSDIWLAVVVFFCSVTPVCIVLWVVARRIAAQQERRRDEMRRHVKEGDQ